ncbi:Methyl-accepting chemotaxis sensory transducer [Sterolibacterium denitrificans]|uniref:Methyl-accepting chemotaxis sensory transducer n=1 Tax=Sterolibacterium denitrificans TaxID=157592 RepID=A0A7Z7MV48_9PROT|nr:methyl-accepting chemotaxis protein [Sterolibacterium denitrificans]SMB26136.1 Methyl-accepting chemotaxis sensory transducer [Sterolibacterium denitrificans]
MKSDSGWWGNLGMQAKFLILIQVFLFVLLGISLAWVSMQMEKLATDTAEERARVIADGAINGLNTLMVTKIGKEDVISDRQARGLFIEKLGTSENVTEVRIIRSEQLDTEFPEGLPQEYPVDDMDRSVLANGKPEYKIDWNPEGVSTLRAVVPFIAMENFRGTRCLMCHGVDEGAVLGAASVTLDISNVVASVRRGNIWIWGSFVAIQVLLFITITLITRHSIIKPLRIMRDGIALIEKEHDLTRRLPSTTSDEIGQTTKAFNNMLEQIQNSFRDIHLTVSRLRQASDNVASASRKVVDGSSNQSDSSGAMAAAIEEMSVSISHVSDNAESALAISRTSQAVSDLGGQIINETVAGMGQISNSVREAFDAMEALGMQSREIDSVVQVIREVADQTNLLALNAAIEAARAGESGRGFAVVADEVRKLAERTSKSTMEISTMIGNIQSRTDDALREIKDVVENVADGQKLAGLAGEKIAEIRQQSARVAESFGDISHALREQNTASQEIARNVEQIAGVTDENLDVAQSMAKDVEHLHNIAKQVDDAVTVFKV